MNDAINPGTETRCAEPTLPGLSTRRKPPCLLLGIALGAAVPLHAATPLEIAQQAYLKASNTGEFDHFGAAVAVSRDTIVVGAVLEPSGASGVNGLQDDEGAPGAGAAYVFVRNGTNWTQQAYLKASNTRANNQFGFAVALDGDTLVVGAPFEDSSAVGLNGDQTSNSAPDSGAAYVFVRDGTNWIQQAYLKASNTGTGDVFGHSVGVSGDTVVVGAFEEDSSATGVNGNQSSNNAPGSGAAYIFVRNGTSWSQEAYLKASNAEALDNFGAKVTVSGDTAAVTGMGDDSNATGVNGNQASNSALNSGAAYVFVRSGTNWTQQAYLKASNAEANDWFGISVALSGDTLVVGADEESSNATGVNGDQSNNSAPAAGAAYVFVRQGTNWSQQTYLKASNTEADDGFGGSVALSGDTAVIAAYAEDSNATGVNADGSNNTTRSAGAAYVFVRNGTNWSQQAYLKASNTDPSAGDEDVFGSFYWHNGVAVSGNTVIVGAPGEDSSATGVNGNQANASAAYAGAAYVFTGLGPGPAELRLTPARGGDLLQLTATGTPGTTWRLEFRDTLTGTTAWQPLTNITLGVSPAVVQQPLLDRHRFYRGTWVP